MSDSSKSILVPVGIVLILAGILSPQIVNLIFGDLGWSRAAAYFADGLRLCFFAGIALLLVGLLRNRKRRKANPKVS